MRYLGNENISLCSRIRRLTNFQSHEEGDFSLFLFTDVHRPLEQGLTHSRPLINMV